MAVKIIATDPYSIRKHTLQNTASSLFPTLRKGSSNKDILLAAAINFSNPPPVLVCSRVLEWSIANIIVFVFIINITEGRFPTLSSHLSPTAAFHHSQAGAIHPSAMDPFHHLNSSFSNPYHPLLSPSPPHHPHLDRKSVV